MLLPSDDNAIFRACYVIERPSHKMEWREIAELLIISVGLGLCEKIERSAVKDMVTYTPVSAD
jgi:hypothetical protein